MTEDDETFWWRRSSQLALYVMVAGCTLGLGALSLVPVLDASAIAGIPNGLFVGGLLVPIVVLFLIFWSDKRQRRIDQSNGYFED